MTTYGSAQSTDRQFDQNKLEKLRNNPDYDYDQFREIEQPKQEKEPIRRNNSSAEVSTGPSWFARNGTILKYIGLVVLVLIIIYILYNVFVGGGFQLFRKNKKVKVKDFDTVDLEEAIQNMEVGERTSLLQDLINKQEFRKAVRVLFLSSLKDMQDANMIVWKKEKTNADYKYEIKKRSIRQLFIDSAFFYDYIWYGENAINTVQFEHVHQKFKELKSSINGQK